ncbi:NAD(P)-dependent oxidoreductase [Neisseria chenwenguii]|uniref:NAD(P)-dependent oxidoreductase n=1 Tax=Neisseria chenwenguii TaxID=1853278 RepID=A0A220RZ24_9NEIS|nr:SDR family oxidoreductase [Neisseria chenwenguii]ASK26403.1 NAD(P)-dependent oxidoreductase [Neisseria chenwenguii]
MKKIAVTGASGNIGGMVARRLAEQHFPLLLPLRNPAKAPDLPGCEVRVCSYGDEAAAKTALASTEVLFMVSAAESPTREAEHESMVRAAKAAGVAHIVYLSFAGAAENSTFTLARTHAATEAFIRASGLRYTFLRDNFYSEMMAELADSDGIISGPSENGRVTCVSQWDVAEAAANVLADLANGNTQHVNQTYTLSGSEALTLAEIAAQLSAHTGRAFRFHNETVAKAFASRCAAYPGTPDWEIEAWVSTYTAIAAGELAEVSPDLEKLIFRRPTTFREVLTRIKAV